VAKSHTTSKQREGGNWATTRKNIPASWRNLLPVLSTLWLFDICPKLKLRVVYAEIDLRTAKDNQTPVLEDRSEK
jgi:hypothetical protein